MFIKCKNCFYQIQSRTDYESRTAVFRKGKQRLGFGDRFLDGITFRAALDMTGYGLLYLNESKPALVFILF